MTVDKEDLREILRLFPIYQVRMIIQERGTGVKSRDQEELIGALVQEVWTHEEYQELIDRLQTIEEEGRPLGYYICTIQQAPKLEHLERELKANEASFNEDGYITEGGYEIHHVSDTELEATRWKIDIEREFNFRTGEVEVDERVKPVDFTVDLDEERVFIDTNQYGKALSVRSKLEKAGFEFGEIGHRNLESDDANQKVKGFVDALEEKLE